MMGVPASWGLATFGSRESATGGWFGAFMTKSATLNESYPPGPSWLPSRTHTLTWFAPASAAEVVQVHVGEASHPLVSTQLLDVAGPLRKNL